MSRHSCSFLFEIQDRDDTICVVPLDDETGSLQAFDQRIRQYAQGADSSEKSVADYVMSLSVDQITSVYKDTSQQQPTLVRGSQRMWPVRVGRVAKY